MVIIQSEIYQLTNEEWKQPGNKKRQRSTDIFNFNENQTHTKRARRKLGKNREEHTLQVIEPGLKSDMATRHNPAAVALAAVNISINKLTNNII